MFTCQRRGAGKTPGKEERSLSALSLSAALLLFLCFRRVGFPMGRARPEPARPPEEPSRRGLRLPPGKELVRDSGAERGYVAEGVFRQRRGSIDDASKEELHPAALALFYL